MRKKILIAAIVIITLPVILLSGLFMTLTHSDTLQGMIISKVIEAEAITEGDLSITFQPTRFSVRMSDYSVKEKETEKTRLQFDQGHIALNPFMWMFGSRNFDQMEIKNGTIDISSSIKKINFSEAKKEDGLLTLKGTIGQQNLNLIKKSKDIDLTIGNVNIQGRLDGSFTDIEDMAIAAGDDVIRGAFEKSGSDIKATINFSKDKVFKFDADLGGRKQHIDVSASKLAYEDLEKVQRIAKQMQKFWDGIKRETPSVAKEIDKKEKLIAEIEIDEFYRNDVLLGRVEMEIKKDYKGMEIDFGGTKLADASMRGDIYISSLKEKRTNVNLDWKDFDYAMVMAGLGKVVKKDTPGIGSLEIDITGEGGSIDSLKKTVDGTIKLRLDKGEIDPTYINFWGGGVVNTLIPSFDKKQMAVLNCAIVHAELKNGQGVLAPIFVDIRRVTIFGKGTVNMTDETVDVLLRPEAKELALGNIASAVRVSGDVANPSIRPDTKSTLKKLGTIALGTINPAFYIFSLTDLGIDEKDVCAK